MPWQYFELFCQQVAVEVDGVRNCRLYGLPGQRQRGIDIVGQDSTGATVVYQVRSRKRFTATDLRRAVADYLNKGRVFNAARFVLCISASGRAVGVQDELRAIQNVVQDFSVELYDIERLTERVRAQGSGSLIEQFFGSAWRKAFWPIGNGRLIRWPLRVEDAKPFDELGVRWSPIAAARESHHPPYISRSLDRVLDQLLTSPAGRVIVLVGPSAAGKSRSAYEALRRAMPRSSLVVPRRPEGEVDRTLLREILNEDLRDHSARRPVMWLDDLHDFLLAGALDPVVLKEWRQAYSDLLIVGTLRDTDYVQLQTLAEDERFTLGAAVARRVSGVLERAHMLRVDAIATAEELAAAQRLYPGADFRHGIGASFVAGPALVHRFEAAPVSSRRLIRLVTDWSRAGMLRPVSCEELEQLWRILDEDPGRFAAALEWSLRPVSAGLEVALVEYAGDGRYRAADYVVHHLDALPEGVGDITSATWAAITAVADADDALRIGIQAGGSGAHEAAIRAFRKARARTESLPVLTEAAVRLALLLDDLNSDEAEAAWQFALERGDPVLRNEARLGLATHFAKRGNLDAAVAQLNLVRSANPEVEVQAETWLGLLYKEFGELELAEQYLQAATEAGDPRHSAEAAYELGNLRWTRGDLEGAESAYLTALELPTEETAAKAALGYGAVAAAKEDWAVAQSAWRYAADLDDLEARAEAEFKLGASLAGQGDLEAGQNWLQRASASNHPEWGAQADMALAGTTVGDEALHDRAREEAFRRVVGVKHPELAPVALPYLVSIMRKRGADEESEILLRSLQRCNLTPLAALAGSILGEMLADAGELDQAADAFFEAAKLRDPEESPRAALRCAALLEDGPTLRSLVEYARQAGDPVVALHATLVLATRMGRPSDPEVNALLRSVIEQAPDSHSAYLARYIIGSWKVVDADLPAGQAILQEVADCPYEDVAEQARAFLSGMSDSS